MSDSLAAQLASVKLRPSKDKTKDFSDPKLAGKTPHSTDMFHDYHRYEKCIQVSSLKIR